MEQSNFGKNLWVGGLEHRLDGTLSFCCASWVPLTVYGHRTPLAFGYRSQGGASFLNTGYKPGFVAYA